MECRNDECPQIPKKPIAMAYVPWQEWRNLYCLSEGFCRGTLFEELDLPFKGYIAVKGCQM